MPIFSYIYSEILTLHRKIRVKINRMQIKNACFFYILSKVCLVKFFNNEMNEL